MQYLYRKSSILPEFLKGADAQLYGALVGSFDVALRPVVVQLRTNYEGGPDFESCMATPWDDRVPEESSGKEENVEPDAESDTGSEDDEDHYYWESRECTKKGMFHLPMVSALRQISREEYMEYTGNEVQLGDKKYFGVGMFVRQKEVAKE
jgi:hypothetical protein